jgi:pseudouridine kinase
VWYNCGEKSGMGPKSKPDLVQAAPRVAVVGAVAVDVKAQSAGPLVRRADVPGRVGLSLGGVARNIAKNLALLGADVTLMSVVGDDAFGRMQKNDLSHAGVNVDYLLTLRRPTATWVGILDERGDLDVGVFGGDILEAVTPAIVGDWADHIAAADLVAVDATLPRSAIDAIVPIARSRGVPLYLNPASVARAATVADCVGDFQLVTANALEAQVLSGRRIDNVEDAKQAAQVLVGRGPGRVIVTLGDGGLVYADPSLVRHDAALPTTVVDTTGAGDALAAMFLFCHLQNVGLSETLARSLRAAAITAGCGESVSERLERWEVE